MSRPKGFGFDPPTKLFAGNVIGPLRARTVPGPWLPAVLVESEPGWNADGPIEMSKLDDETALVTVDCPAARRKRNPSMPAPTGNPESRLAPQTCWPVT